MKRILLATLIAANALLVRAEIVTPIIPAPMKAEAHEGTFHLTPENFIQADDRFKNEAKLFAKRLRVARNWDDSKARTAVNEKRLDLMNVNFRSLSKPN